MSSILWATPDRQRYFVINEADTLSAGDFIIRTASGREISVSADTLKSYEVSPKEAIASWLDRCGPY